MVQGKSNGPAQGGRKPGRASEPAPGLSCANLVPPGNPSDCNSVGPWIDKVPRAIERLQTGPKRQLHAVAGELGLNEAGVRQALQARGLLTVGIPKTVNPIEANPKAQAVDSQCPSTAGTGEVCPRPGHLQRRSVHL